MDGDIGGICTEIQVCDVSCIDASAGSCGWRRLGELLPFTAEGLGLMRLWVAGELKAFGVDVNRQVPDAAV